MKAFIGPHWRVSNGRTAELLNNSALSLSSRIECHSASVTRWIWDWIRLLSNKDVAKQLTNNFQTTRGYTRSLDWRKPREEKKEIFFPKWRMWNSSLSFWWWSRSGSLHIRCFKYLPQLLHSSLPQIALTVYRVCQLVNQTYFSVQMNYIVHWIEDLN